MEFSMNTEEKDISFAKTISEEYTDINQKSKAFLAALGTSAFKNYLKDCDIQVEDDSLFRIKQIFELTDIADVFANDVCIDVRTYTNSDALYVPKKHFENDIIPKYYVFALYNEPKQEIILKGFIPSNNVNKDLKSENYYVVDSSNLLPMEELIQAILTEEPQEQTINVEELSGLFTAFIDNEISQEQKINITKLLYNCAQGRKNLIEFSQFEFLASNLSNFPALFDEQEILNETEEENEIKEQDTLEEDGLPIFEEEDLEFLDADETDFLESSEDFDNEENLEISKNEEQENSDNSSFAQTIASTGMAASAFAAGAALGAAASEAIDTTQGITDITSSAIDAAENVVETLDDLVNSDEVKTENDDLLLQEESSPQLYEEEEIISFDESDDDILQETLEDSDDEFINFEDDTNLQEENNIESDIEDINSDEEITFDINDEELFDKEEAEEELQNNDEDILLEQDDLNLLQEENDNDNYQLQGDNKEETLETSDNNYFSQEIQNDEEIIDENHDDIPNIDNLSLEDSSIPEIIENNTQEEFDISTEPQITEEEQYVDKDNEYDYSDLDSLLEELQPNEDVNEESSQIQNIEQNEFENINSDTQENNETVGNEHIETLYEQSPEQSELQNELNEEEYAKYVEAPSANAKKNVVIPAVGIITAVSLMAYGGYTISKNLSNKFSNTITSYNQQPVSEMQMKSVDDFDDETFLEKSEMDILANGEQNEMQEDGVQNQNTQIPNDLNQSISNIFDETIYPVTISKIAWEIPEIYTTSKYFKKYLQIAGVQLQRDLQANLAKVNETSETEKIKISFDINEQSVIKNFKILETSGSKEIDTAVETSLKNTLSYIKVPVIPSGEKFVTLTLVINF